jgi:glycosyltransferase involved in cell wall biosynthesis
VKIGIYNEPSGGGIGGSEVTVAVLGEALASRHQVDIIHHRPDMDSARLAEISGTCLSAVRMRYVAPEPYSFGSARAPWRRYREARNWQAALSEPYDLFINFTHGFPPFCHARKGALVVLFPFRARPYSDARAQVLPGSGSPILDGLKTIYHEWEWRKRMDTYQIKATISRFSQEWTKRRWGVDCAIIHPPVDTSIGPGIKKNAILSVGRFTATGHTKKQLEMVAAFGELQDAGLRDWDYFCVGGLGDTSEDRAYFQGVRGKALGRRAQVLANIERGRLKELYGQASLFWHAAGYGEGDERPELSEHFGIATVEAMSAGCVPLVINKGGQPEIVQHGVSGFLWNTLEELKERTELLSEDGPLRSQMAEAARARAALFSREQFVNRFLSLMDESA